MGGAREGRCSASKAGQRASLSEGASGWLLAHSCPRCCCTPDRQACLLSPLAAGLYYGRHVEEDSAEGKLPLHGPNQWPDEASSPG